MNGDATWTVTVHLWWLWTYLLVGILLWLPLEWWAWRSICQPPPFRSWLGSHFKKYGVIRSVEMVVATIALWPITLWDAVT